MKILFVSMHSVHTIRWIENLKDSPHELFWFDVLGRGKLETIEGVKQFTDWNHRKLPYIKGEYFLRQKVLSQHELSTLVERHRMHNCDALKRPHRMQQQ